MAATYPSLLATGMTPAGRFDPFDLFITAPEMGSPSGQAADGQALRQFELVMFDVDGRLVPWGASGEHSTANIVLTGQPSNADTVTINGVVLTFKTTATLAADVQIGATAAATAANLAAVINGTNDSVNDNTGLTTYGTVPLAGTGVTASVDATGLIVTVSAVQSGTGGNALTLAESASNLTVSSATLTGAEADHSTGSLNFTGVPANADTLTINGNAITFVNGAPGAHQVQRDGGATATVVAQATKAEINAFPGLYGVTAAGAGIFLALSATAEGVGGNAVTLAHSATQPVLSAATLTGGGVSEPDPAARPIGVMAQPVAASTPGGTGPYWSDGVFNHHALVWPASVATLAQRKRALAGTPIGVDQLL